MTLDEYMRDVAEEMSRKSARIRRDFSTHRLSAGTNREELVATFLREHLPERFGVSTGLIISHDGMFSNEADLVVFDRPNNSPLYPTEQKKLWPVEGIYALIEVKTQLSPRDLRDAVKKVQRFKRLQRKFMVTTSHQQITDSLAVIWSFSASEPLTLKANLTEILASVPTAEQPDFIVVPDSLVAQSGLYLELSRLGQENSAYRRKLEARFGSDLSFLLEETMVVDDLGNNALLTWHVWFDSWLRQAGPRFSNPADYLPEQYTFGKRV